MTACIVRGQTCGDRSVPIPDRPGPHPRLHRTACRDRDHPQARAGKGDARHDGLAVLAFWSDAAWLTHLDLQTSAEGLTDRLLELPNRGLTNVAFPLSLAARELAGSPSSDSRVLLLSDCVHNAGPDPRPAAALLPRLDVLLDVTGEHDLELGRELAQLGRGRVNRIGGHRDIAPALNLAFAG